MKDRYFLRYLDTKGKWHKIPIGKTTKLQFLDYYDAELQRGIYLITKGKQQFKAAVYQTVMEQVK